MIVSLARCLVPRSALLVMGLALVGAMAVAWADVPTVADSRTTPADAPGGSALHASTKVLFDKAKGLTGDTWTAISTASAPTGRSFHTIAWTLHTAVWTGNRMIIWGGGGSGNTGGVYDPGVDGWSFISTANAPSSRSEHRAVWTGSRMVVWGGQTEAGAFLSTGGIYDPAGNTWTATSTASAPSARDAHSAVWTGDRMVVWGGYSGSILGTGGIYDPTTDTWTPTSPTNAPTARYAHSAVWTGSRMIIWGGCTGSFVNTGGIYDPASNTWTPTSTTNAPTGRSNATAVWTGSRMIVWGGYNGSVLSTGGIYDPATNIWAAASTLNAPSARKDNTAVWTGNYMVIWGGHPGNSVNVNTGGIYDPATNTWTATSTTDAPTGCNYPSAVWTGDRMIVWGGEDQPKGGLYNPSNDAPLVTLSQDSSTIPEAGGVATFTATLSAMSGLPVTVTLAFSGTAIFMADYTRSGTQIVIPAGSTSGSITMTAVQDALDEPDETVTVDISAVTNGTENGTQQQTTLIADDDEPPTVTLSRNNATIAEAGGASVFTATLSAVSILPVTVDLAFSGTATLTSDYTRSSTRIVIPVGSTSGSVTVAAVQDALDEADETVIVDIAAVTNGIESVTQQQTATISDDDQPPTVTLSRSAATIAEAGGVATITATLSAASGLPVTVELAFSGTAALTADYTCSGTQIVIPAGSTSGSITVTAVQDAIDEANRTLVVDIHTVTNGSENGTQQQSTMIVDDDAGTLFVDCSAVGANNGASWANAYTDLQAALAAAGSGDEIWVATGTYTPTSGTDRTVSFPLKSGVGLYGGFAGTETARDERNWVTNVTTLSGDIGVPVTATDNSYNVVTAINVSAVTMDGFSICHGRADHASQPNLMRGAGLNVSGSTVTVRHMEFRSNYTSYDGGGMRAESSTLIIEDSHFEQNQAGHYGGGLSSRYGSDTLDGVTFAHNSSGNEGGGISFYSKTAVSWKNGVMYHNESEWGGGMALNLGSYALVNLTLVGNSAGVGGGVDGNQSPTVALRNCVLWGNTVREYGAQVHPSAGVFTYYNCDIQGSGGSAAWDSTLGTNGGGNIDSDPQFVSATDPDGADDAWRTVDDGLRLLACSPCVDTGTASGAPSGDIVGLARPQGDGVDIGAYEGATASVDFVLSTSGLGEGDRTAGIAVGLCTPSPISVTVEYATSNGTATAGSDYTATSGTLTFSPGETLKTISVPVTNDTLDEGDESLTVVLSCPTNAVLGATTVHTLKVIDDDPPPTVALSRGDASIAEAGGVTAFIATLSAISGLPVTVDLAFGGTATFSADYTRSGTRIVIPAGSMIGTITVTAVQDALDEADETVIVDIGAATNGIVTGSQQQTATVIDDDEPPTVTLGRSSGAAPGNVGDGNLLLPSFTNYSFGSGGFDQWELVGAGTRQVEDDASAEDGKSALIREWSAGVSVKSPAFTPTQGVVAEARYLNPSGVSSCGFYVWFADGTGVKLEEVENASYVTRTYDLSPYAGRPVQVGFIGGYMRIDYLKIRAPAVSPVSDGSAIPEAGGIATFTATLSAVSGLPVTVDLAFSGTATLAGDYTCSGTQIVIPVGSSSGSVTVAVIQDALDEVDETVVVDIRAVSNGTENGVQQQTTTIIDDDVPVVSLSRDNASIAEAGGVATFTATLSLAPVLPVTVDLEFSGTATTMADYTPSGTQVVIPAGSTSGSFTVTAAQDTMDEVDETVIVGISTVTNGTENGTQQQAATIVDDDPPPSVILSRDGGTVAEASGATTFTATLSAVSGLPVTVALAFGGTATFTADYTRSSTQITIPAGSTSGGVTVTAVQDTLYEGDETVIVDISTVTNGTESGTQQQTTVIADDDQPPTVTLSQSQSDPLWTSTSTTNVPPARTDFTAVWTGSRMIVWGGKTAAGTVLNSGGLYDPVTDTWTPTSTANAPTGRRNHAAVWTGSRMIVWGGRTATGAVLNSGGIYDPTTDTWAVTSTTNTPPARDGLNMAVWTGSRMIVWGGNNDAGAPMNSGGVYDPADNTWATTSPVNAPAARRGFAMVWTGSHMIVWGGSTSDSPSGMMNTGGVYDPASNTWTPTSTAGSPAARHGHSAVWTGSRMVVMGGWDGSGFPSTGGVYDPADNTWTAAATTNGPGGRELYAPVWTGGRMIVWGGRGNGASTSGLYDPASDAWTGMSTTGAPSARYSYGAVWTGSAMVVWGGAEGASVLNTGGIYSPGSSDPAGPPSLGGSNIAEAGGVATFTATLSAVSGLPVTVGLAFSGTATVTSDYTRSGTQIVIPAACTSGAVTVTAVQDTLYEGDETVVVDVDDVTNGTENDTQQQTTTIIDDEPPAVVVQVTAGSSDGAYTVGAVIDIQVLFSTAVYVTGTPRLMLETGATDAVVDIFSGSGTNTLTFPYTVAAGHNSGDLDYTSPSALSLNGGTIRDGAGNDAVLLLPAPGTAGSLGASQAIVIDTIPPGPPAVDGTPLAHTAAPTWTWASGGGGVGLYRFSLDDLESLSSAVQTNQTAFVPSIPLSEGPHVLYVQERDTAGNWSAAGDSVTVVDAVCVVTLVAGTHGSIEGDTVQIVPYGGGTTPVEAVPDYLYVFAGSWSEGSTANPLTLTDVHEDTTVSATFRAANPVAPTGGFLAVVDAAAVLSGTGLWDLSGTYATIAAGHWLVLNLVHDTGGRLTGTATYTVAKATILTMPIRGSANGSAGSVTMVGTLRGSTLTPTLNVALKLDLTVDTATHSLTGRMVGGVKSGATTTAVDDPLVLALPMPMDGTWTLAFQLGQAGRTVAGTALLTMSNGVHHSFAVQGRASGTAAVLELQGNPADPTSKAIRIRTTITSLEGGWARVNAFSGRGYGQTLSW